MADSITETPVVKTKSRGWFVDFFTRLVKEKPLGVVGGIITLLLLLTGIFADVISPYGMNETWVGGYLEPPSAAFPFGTDNVGRDILSRVIYGARISVIVGLAASALSTAMSVVIGVLSGYIGGKFDLTVQRGVDTWMCLPSLVVLMVIMSAIGPGIFSIIIVLGITRGIGGSRLIRGAVIGIKENVYVQAGVAIGSPTWRILLRHILPNIMSVTVILFSVRVPAIVMTEASLSFLGFGIPAPFPSWGGMLSGAGRMYMYDAPWIMIWPGVALAIVVYGINMFGDAVRDIIDPRLRGGVGRFDAGDKQEKAKPKAQVEPANSPKARS